MKKDRMRMLVIALAAILVTLFTQPALAFYTTTGIATNVITSGDIRLVIHEKTASGEDFPKDGVYVIPGDIVSKRVTIENVCAHPFYLRVKLVQGIDSDELSVDDCLKVDLNTEYWTLKEDGYIYFNGIVQPGETVPAVFTQVEIVGDKVNQSYIGSTLSLTVTAQAVQSENNPAENPWDASGWPAD